MSTSSFEELFDVVTGPKVGGGGDLVASNFRVKLFFYKNFCRHFRSLEGGGGGFLKKAKLRVNRAFRAISQ